MGYKLNLEQMDDIIKKLQKKYIVYGPKRLAQQGKNIGYGKINSWSEIVHKEKSDFSPKEIFYPIVQTLLYFKNKEVFESSIDTEKEYIVFARPCDINGIERLDTIFLTNGGIEDNYYKRLREKVKIFMIECTTGWENCFCVSMGTNKTHKYSVAVSIESDNIKVQIKEEVFQEYFEYKEEVKFNPSFIENNFKKVNIPKIEDRALLPKIIELDYWKKFEDKCISCGGCNTACITCSCFDTVDITYNETSLDGERRRIWSSCMLKGFTTMAGGHCVRNSPGSRMGFKTLHKVYDYKYRFNDKVHMCVGCGRCDNQCPKEISFSETINNLSKEVENLVLSNKEGK